MACLRTTYLTPRLSFDLSLLFTAGVVLNAGFWLFSVSTTSSIAEDAYLHGYAPNVHSAMTLPFLALATPAGWLANLLSARKLIIISQAIMVGVAATVAGLLTFGLQATTTLGIGAFAYAVAAALAVPVWTALTGASRHRGPAALATLDLGFGLGRIAGACLGSLAIEAQTLPLAFVSVAACAAWLLIVLRTALRGPTFERPVGLDVNAQDPPAAVQRTAASGHAGLTLPTFGFSLAASAALALLPSIIRQTSAVEHSAIGYLAAFFSVGTMAASAAVSTFGLSTSRSGLLRISGVILAVSLLLLALSERQPTIAISMAIVGASWDISYLLLTTRRLNASRNNSNVRIAGMQIFASYGGFVVGGPLWGAIAATAGLTTSLALAALIAIIPVVYLSITCSE